VKPMRARDVQRKMGWVKRYLRRAIRRVERSYCRDMHRLLYGDRRRKRDETYGRSPLADAIEDIRRSVVIRTTVRGL